MKKVVGSVAVILGFTVLSMAQPTPAGVLEPGESHRVYKREMHQQKQIIPYEHIREADVFWETMIWRVIPVAEKMNLPFKYEKKPLITVLLDAIKNGELQVYSSFDEEFQGPPLSDTAVARIGTSADTVLVLDPETGVETPTYVEKEFNPESVTRYRLREVWFFDKESSTLMVRIVGLAPVFQMFGQNGNLIGETPMFWAYYPDLRNLLVNHESFNPLNDAQRMTWEEIFEMRLFSSYIYKESNVYDRRVEDYKAAGLDMLLESEKIKNKIFEFEHNLWDL